MNITRPLASVSRKPPVLLLCGALCACAGAPPAAKPAAPAANDRYGLDAAFVARALQNDAAGGARPAVKLDPADPKDAWVTLGDAPDGNVERYYSKVYLDATETARLEAARRASVEEVADKAAGEAQARADEARKSLGTAPPDPDDSPDLVAEKRRALLAAFDAKTPAMVEAARRKVIDDARRAQRYVDEAKSEADLKAKLDSLNAAIDAIYSDGIARAIERLNAEYELPGNPRRVSAERLSGYDGEYYKLERVERYFKENWAGEKKTYSVENCKAALGFRKDRESADLKDPNADNVDSLCGVREGLVALLISYKGTNKPPVSPDTAGLGAVR